MAKSPVKTVASKAAKQVKGGRVAKNTKSKPAAIKVVELSPEKSEPTSPKKVGSPKQSAPNSPVKSPKITAKSPKAVAKSPKAAAKSPKKKAPKEPKTYTVEAIRAVRLNKDKKILEYCVKWKDYKESQNTWEPEEHFEDPDVLQEFWDAVKSIKQL